MCSLRGVSVLSVGVVAAHPCPHCQAGNIDLVFDNTVKSTENVRAGNEEIREVRHMKTVTHTHTHTHTTPQPGPCTELSYMSTPFFFSAQAIKNRATYRAVVMFILIMLSTALLFLNWYT